MPMGRLVALLLVCLLVGCATSGPSQKSAEEQVREYSATAVSLSDFSMKIMAHFQSQGLSVPSDFDAAQFFALLEKIYPDQTEVEHIRSSYRVSARSLDGGYSVMLCDQSTGRKIMEDLSCRLDRVEIRSWENSAPGPCAFEDNWKPLCK